MIVFPDSRSATCKNALPDNNVSTSKRGYRLRAIVLSTIACALATALPSSSSHAQIQFEEKTTSAGKFDDVESWGASWGDMNGDLWPDLFVTNHRMRPSLFRNNGDGSFTNVVLQWDKSRTWLNDPLADEHGGSWSDFDEDGDLDLSVITGISFDGHLFINTGDGFVESGASFGVTNDREGRLPLWFDYNNDGNIDLAYMSGSSARMFEWTENAPNTPPFAPFPYKTVSDFSDSKLGHWCFRNQYGFLIDLDGDDVMELVCASEGNFPQHALDYEGGVFEINTELLTDQVSNSVDSTTGDFNGDLLPDILVMRGNLMPNEAQYIPNANGDNKRIESWLSTGTGNGLRTIRFRTQGPVNFTAMSNQIAVPWRIFVGASATPLGPVEQNTGNAKTPFTLDPADPANHGIASAATGFDPDASENRGTFVGYDPVTDLWSLSMSPGSESVRALYVIESANTVTDLDLTGAALRDGPVSPAMLINTDTGVDSTPESLYNVGLYGDLSKKMMCVSAAAGDFDNDMDLDVYVVCRGGVENLPNRLFENDGSGYFTEVANGGGAPGLVGLGLQSKAGTGESVVMADYDVDGNLDLFVTNGLNLQPFREGAQDQLFRNKSNTGNHWVQIDLEGTVSNRDGVGATLYATTPDGVVQLREQNGGYHRWSQNHTRIHFGLGANTTFDLEVRWPSGLVDNHTGISSNQLIKVVEAQGVSTLIPGPAAADPAVVAGDECGSPRYLASEDVGLFIWKDCTAQTWTVELSSGDSTTTVSQLGAIESNKPFGAIATNSFESNDFVNNTTPELINFKMNAVNGGNDSFSFELPADATACLTLNSPSLEVFLGAGHVRATTPMNLADPSVGCLQLSSSDVTVNESAGSVEVTISLDGAASEPVTLEVGTVAGSASAPEDFIALNPNPTPVSFAVGTTTQTINIPIVDDALFEPTETFSLAFSNVTGASNVATPVTVTIVDDDASIACGKPPFNPATQRRLAVWKDCGSNNWHLEASAGGANGVLHTGTITADTDLISWQAVSFESNDFTTPPANPASPQYDPTPASLSYNLKMSGNGTDGINFTVSDDSATCLTTDNAAIAIIVGASATVVSSGFNLATLGPCTTSSVEVEIADVSVSENAGSVAVPVTLSAAADVTVQISTSADSATEASDFLPLSGQSLSFDAGGPITQTVVIDIVNDSTVETSETFSVTLTNATGANIADPTAVVTIIDDDTNSNPVCGTPSVLPVAPASARALYVWNDCGTDNWHMLATAGNSGAVADHRGQISISNGTFVTKAYPSNPPYSNASTNALYGKRSFEGIDRFAINANTVDYRFKMNGAGFDGVDFTLTAGSSFCLDNTSSDSSLIVLLGANKTPAPTNEFRLDASGVGSCATQTLPSVSVSDVSLIEGTGPAMLALTLSHSAATAASVSVSTSNGSASAGSDYTAIGTPQTVSFSAGGPSISTVTIPILDDAVTEPLETFSVNLTNPSGLVIEDDSAVVTIVDDDASVGCGQPNNINPATERALFVWRECGTRIWHLRATAGGNGQPAATHTGSIAVTGSLINQSYPANVPYDNTIVATRFGRQSFEGIDAIIAPAGSNPLVEYLMKMSGVGFDGFTFEANAGTTLCMTNQSPGLAILLGSQRTPASAPSFNPDTNQACF